MKSIFNPVYNTEIIDRISQLSPEKKPLWGKMSVSQMVRHCALCEEYYQGAFPVKRSFIGRIIGRHALNGILQNGESTLQRNAPTAKLFLVTEVVEELEAEKMRWKKGIEAYLKFRNNKFIHWFFGNMSYDQLGQFVYKHCDHHLRQFGV